MAKTAAEALRDEGKREMLLKQLKVRFKKVPPEIEAKIQATQDTQQLDTWLVAFATARKLSDIPFDEGT
jgi:hypothetical protein